MRSAKTFLAAFLVALVSKRVSSFSLAPLRMTSSTGVSAEVQTAAKIPTERYIACNRFVVREGSEATFEARWANRKSRLAELPGFRYFHLMKREAPEEGKVAPDEYNYMSFTIWDTKEDFEAWRSGPAFKEAHGGGGLMAFVRMFQSLAIMKGPPRPAFFEAILPLANPEAKRMPIVDGWRDVTADGINILDPEAYVATNRFSISEPNAAAFEQRWASRTSSLLECEGFQNFNMLRRDGNAEDGVNYISTTIWKNKESFAKWREGQAFKNAHGQPAENKDQAGKPTGGPDSSAASSIFKKPPQPVFWEAKLTLLSEKGY